MRFSLLLSLATAALVATTTSAAPQASNELCFPKGFMLGSATASYQVEGAWNEGGRTTSIWDDFCREHHVACADVADDFYHRYVTDIQMMKEAGHKSFRFSISWSRAMNWDNSTKHMKPNPTGIAFYHALIDELNRNDIEPILTIYHWDLPSELQTQLPAPYGWLRPEIQDHFVEFSTLLFNEFGSKVSFWTTFNEPLSFSLLGYGGGLFGLAHAPGHAPSDTVMYIAAHNVLLSHAKAVKKFRELKDQHVIRSNARIGIVLVSEESVPLDPTSAADIEAAERSRQFMVGWWLNPIVNGDYPAVMRERVGDRLPKFSAEQSAMLRGSYDLFMVNHYNTHLTTDCHSATSKAPCDSLALGWMKDLGVDNAQKPKGARPSSVDANGRELCAYAASVPEGYRSIIQWTHAFNQSTDILLTENGFCGNDVIDNQDQLWYHQKYLEQVHKAITEDKIPVIGYTAWSLMDNYEWGSFKPRFGLYYVNYTSKVGSTDPWTPKADELQRIPRTAAKWFAKVAQTGCMTTWQEGEKVEEIVSVKSASTTVLAAHGWNTFWLIAAVAVVICVVALVIVRRRTGDARERSPLLH